MRPITPAHASIASLSVVLPDDAWPTMAKFRRSRAEDVAINSNPSCSKHASDLPRAQAEILVSLFSRIVRAGKKSFPGLARRGLGRARRGALLARKAA